MENTKVSKRRKRWYGKVFRRLCATTNYRKLILKGLVKKERCELDERRVIVTIKREKFSKVTMLIQACYNYLEKGIQVKLNNK